MITLQINHQAGVVKGSSIYTGWFLSFDVDESLLESALGITSEMKSLGAVPRLMLVRIGEKGAFKVSPISGKVLGIEFFGVRVTNSEILNTPTPKPHKSASLTVPLNLPYHPVIFEQGSGEVESLEAGFRHIGYKVAAGRGGDRFRVQLFRAGEVVEYLRIASSVVIGIDERGGLAEIWFDPVQPSSAPHLPLG